MNNRKTNGKLPNTWRLNSTLLNNIWVKEYVSEDIWKIFWTKQTLKSTSIFEKNNENSAYKFIILNAIMSKEDRSKTTI